MTCILFCGDTFLRTKDNSDPFARIADKFADSVVCLNLETSLEGPRRKQKNVSLCVSETALNLIPHEAQILGIVNNHAADGLEPAQLCKALVQRQKKVIGPANPSMEQLTIDKMTVAFFAAYFNLPRTRVSYDGARANQLEKMLQESVADRKMVYLHWGYEHTDVPAPFQRQLAHRLIDAGADCIIGHHPHVPQGRECYAGKWIYYSLGNFNFWHFDAATTEKNRWGYMVAYDMSTGTSLPIPYRINDAYQPFQVRAEEEAQLLAQLQQLGEAVSEMDDESWFSTEYSGWYAREMRVWRRRCLQHPFTLLWAKWIVWMLMPMQLKYYFSALTGKR